jgi:hypothetical protein
LPWNYTFTDVEAASERVLWGLKRDLGISTKTTFESELLPRISYKKLSW